MNNWNFELIFKNEEEFNNAIITVKEMADKLASYSSKLADKEEFISYLNCEKEVNMLLERVIVYASMIHDLNQKDNASQERYEKMINTYNYLVEKTSFFDPEVLSISKSVIEEWLEDSRLSVYKYRFTQLFRGKDHVLDSKSEGLIATLGKALGEYNNLYDKLAVADNSAKEVTLSDGSTITVNQANYGYYLETLTKQEDRKKVFEALFSHYYNHRNTFAGIYSGILNVEQALTKIRGYKDILDSHLYDNNIDESVFLSLVAATKENTLPVKRYYELKRKYNNLEQIHTYDRFVPFAHTDVTYTYEEAKNIFFEATKLLGEEFHEISKKVLEEGRVSVYPNDGKRTGAYSTGLYNEGPFIMLNHNDTLDSMFTLAHEAGHSMHTYYANSNQLYQTASYEIFVAEIASTFNESLLLDYLMKNIKDEATKITLIDKAIQNILSTFYRQTLFATYEYEAHKLVEKGEAITATALSNIMIDLYKQYYDIDLDTEEYKKAVFAYIPHFFHTPFYVYQYATSFAASSRIYEAVKNNEENALERYLDMLKAGGSDYPLNIVKRAGVDLTKKETFLSVCNRLDELVSELERLLNAKK